MDDESFPYTIKIKFGRNSDGLNVGWLDNHCVGKWAVGKEQECYELLFEYEQDALLTWWKWG